MPAHWARPSALALTFLGPTTIAKSVPSAFPISNPSYQAAYLLSVLRTFSSKQGSNMQPALIEYDEVDANAYKKNVLTEGGLESLEDLRPPHHSYSSSRTVDLIDALYTLKHSTSDQAYQVRTALQHLWIISWEEAPIVVQLSGIPLILRALLWWPDEAGIHVAAIGTLQNLASAVACASFIAPVVQSMQRFPGHCLLQMSACTCLAQLACAHGREIHRHRGPQFILLAALRWRHRPALQEAARIALNLLGFDKFWSLQPAAVYIPYLDDDV
jgi:hypothetical protein